MRDDDEGLTINGCTAIHETDRAVLVSIPTVGDTWIPKSQIVDGSEVNAEGDEGALMITKWFARKEGLE
jgi:hypothetical protein